jgi:hypothetical protein
VWDKPPTPYLPGKDRRPRLAEGADIVERCSERWLVAEIAATLGLPLPPLDAVAGAAFAGPFDLGGGEPQAGPDLWVPEGRS